MESIENCLCGILDKYCADENCDKEELSGIRDIRIVKSIWSEIENLRPDIAKKQGRDKGDIRVAQYLTAMPPKEELEEKLRLAIQRAKIQLEQRKE